MFLGAQAVRATLVSQELYHLEMIDLCKAVCKRLITNNTFVFAF